jgi:Holliday junction DNA helicase RuvA
VGAEIELEIRPIVREDANAILLYGFATAQEKQAFDLLLNVQHVGAKLALAVLSVLSPKIWRRRLPARTLSGLTLCPAWGSKSRNGLYASCATRLAESA